jgi:hypothetical protein
MTFPNLLSGLAAVANHWAMRQGHSFDCWLVQPVDKAMPVITRNIDRSIWRDLMLKSGMLTLMDAEARAEWAKNLEETISRQSAKRIS